MSKKIKEYTTIANIEITVVDTKKIDLEKLLSSLNVDRIKIKDVKVFEMEE